MLLPLIGKPCSMIPLFLGAVCCCLTHHLYVFVVFTYELPVPVFSLFYSLYLYFFYLYPQKNYARIESVVNKVVQKVN